MATETFRELAGTPLMGAPRKVRKPEFQGVRMWHVRGFESYLILSSTLPARTALLSRG